MLSIELIQGVGAARRAFLRPLQGRDEVLMQHGDYDETLELIQRLLVDQGEETLAPDNVLDMTISDVDRVVASLYLNYMGNRIESTAICSTCGKPFDVSFSLEDSITALGASVAEDSGVAGPDRAGVYALNDGRRFRLPTVRDLRGIRGSTPGAATQRLRQVCVVEGDSESDPETLDDAMNRVGPTLDADLPVCCPSCEGRQTVRFTLQNFFGRALAFERRFLNHEVHQLARAYGWQRSEILAMTREDRRTHVRFILSERSVSARPRTNSL